MKKRHLTFLLVGLVLLVSLFGCAGAETAEEDATIYEGNWYFATTGVECRFQEGKIYQDDLHAKEGQTLMGIYSQAEDHIEANLVGMGGVHIPHSLYLVSGDNGTVLCDSATGDGTVYFYQDALSALAAVEAVQTSAPPDPTPGSILPLPPLDTGPGPTNEDQNADRSIISIPSGEPELATAVPSPTATSSAVAERSNGSTVWISKTGSKYHSDPNCSGMKTPSQLSRSEAENKGYTPCKRCY